MCNIYLDSFSFSSHISCFISSMLFTNLKWKRLRDSARMCVPVGTFSKNLAHQEKKRSVCALFEEYKKYLDLFFCSSLIFHPPDIIAAVWCPEDPSCVGVHFPSLLFTAGFLHLCCQSPRWIQCPSLRL